MQGLFHPAVRVWTFLAETHMGEGKLETVGVLASQNPCMRGVGKRGEDGDIGGKQASRRGEGTERGASHPHWPPLFFP